MVIPDPASPSTAVLIDLKVVPGAKRDVIAGRLGDRLKIRVSAPPEGGKANDAIRALLARELGVKERDVELIRGHTSPEKTVRVSGVTPQDVQSRWQ